MFAGSYTAFVMSPIQTGREEIGLFFVVLSELSTNTIRSSPVGTAVVSSDILGILCWDYTSS